MGTGREASLASAAANVKRFCLKQSRRRKPISEAVLWSYTHAMACNAYVCVLSPSLWLKIVMTVVVSDEVLENHPHLQQQWRQEPSRITCREKLSWGCWRMYKGEVRLRCKKSQDAMTSGQVLMFTVFGGLCSSALLDWAGWLASHGYRNDQWCDAISKNWLQKVVACSLLTASLMLGIKPRDLCKHFLPTELHPKPGMPSIKRKKFCCKLSGWF